MTRKIRNGVLGSIFFVFLMLMCSSPALAAYTHTFSYVAGGAPGTADCVLLSSFEQNGFNDIYVVTLPYDTTAITSVTNVGSGYSYVYAVKITTCDTLAKIPFDDSKLIHNTDFTTETANKYWEYFYMYEDDDYYVSQAVADAGYSLITTDVKGFGFKQFDLSGRYFKVIVQLTGSTGPVTVDKTALNDAITAAEDLDAADYWTADDRWDGTNTYSGTADGFWADFQAKLTAAQAVAADDNATVVGVSDATTALTGAQAKLMPKTKVNATLLHENVNQWKTTTGSSLYYSTKTWIPFNLALTNGQSILAGLYGPLGDSSVSKQTAVDNACEELNTAGNNLMALADFDKAQIYYDAILHLDKLFRFTESDSSKYTAGSWAAYVSARDDAAALVNDNPINDNLLGSVFKAYQTMAYFKACYFGLESAAGEITVSVRVADNLGAKYPQYALTDSHTAAFNKTVTLTGGNYSVQDLVDAETLNFAANMTGAGQQHIFSYWFIYVNGVLVADPYDGWTVFEKTIYDDHGVPVNDFTIKDAAANSLGRGNFQLKDGDEVVFVRAEQPGAMYYISWIDASYQGYQDFLSLLSIAKEGDGEIIEVKEGESFSLTVDKTAAKLLDYPAAARPAANVSLVYSDPADSADSVTGAVHDSGVVTDSDGSAELALYQAGWYTVSTVDIRNQTLGSVALDGSESGGVYPNLAGGDSIVVHVLSLEEAELAAALEDYQTNLDALLAKYSKEAFGPALWKQAQSAYYTAKSAVYDSISLAGAQSALNTCKTTLDSLQAQAKTANAKVLSDISWYLNRLPNIDQISQGLFNQGDIDYYQKASVLYNAMSAYQKGLLTTAQAAQYQAMTAAYGSDGSTLPTAQTYTMTVQCEPANYGDKLAIFVLLNRAHNADGIGRTETKYADQNLATAFTCQFEPGVYLGMDLDKVNLASGYEVYKVESSYADINDHGNVLPSARVFSIHTQNMPRANVTVTIYVRQAGELTLDEAKDDAKTAITAEFGTYDNGYYTTGRWNQLVQAYKEGLAAVDAAASKAAVDSAKTDAFAAMAAVPKRSPDDYGSVKVEFYNTTYSGGLGYNATEPFVSETMDLAAADSMMSIALKALNKDGYTWTGSGGKGYNISYLSSVMKDDTSLGEFGNGSQSGWMGMLNDWFTSEGFTTYYVDATDPDHKLRDGDIIKIMYTSSGYGTDIGGTWGNGDTSLTSLSVDGLTLQNDFSSTTLNYVATADSSLFGNDISVVPTAANKNYQVRTFLNTKNTTAWYRPGETIPAETGDIIYIGVGESSWPSMNKVGAEAVDYTATWYKIYVVGDDDDSVNQLISLIDALPAVANATLTDQNGIDFAKTYYDTLRKSDQAKVTNTDKLNDLLQRMIDLQEVVDIKAAIDALPAADAVTEADAEAINTVFDTYTAFQPWQKNLIVVSYTDKLTAVKDAIDLLTGDPSTIVTNLINALPATITLDDQDAVEKARVAFDGLTEVQQAYVTATTLRKLTEAEKTIETLTDAPSTAVTNQINTLPATITLDNKDAVTSARTAYDALSDGQKAKVSAPTLNKLTAAETTIKALEDAAILPKTEEKVTTLKPDATVANQIATVTLGDDTVSNLADAAKSDGATEIVIAPENDDAATAVVLTMSKTTLNDLLGKTTAKLTFSTALGDVTLSNAALIALNNAGDGPIMITVEQGDDNTIKVTIKNGDTVLDQLGAITVKFAADGITKSTVVMKKNDDNTKTLLKKAVMVSNITTSTVTVSPKYRVIVPLSGSATLQLVDNSQSFSDTSSHWAANNIAFVAARGLLQGTGKGKFSPDAQLTRGMLVAILWRLEEEPKAAAAGFSDVSDSAYYAKAVDWAKANNIVSGVGNNKFDPDGNITRQDMITIMARYAAYLGITVNGELSHIAGYSDYGQISTYAQTAMAWAYDHKIVAGTSATHLSPTGTATRAQFAAIIERFLVYHAD